MDKPLVARYVRQILNQCGMVRLCCICCSSLNVIKITPILCFRYAKYLNTKDTIKRDPGKVIAMSLHGKDPSQTRGALRNAQQAPVFFPGWTLRIYTISDNVTGNPVPKRLLNKMETLGAEVFYVDKPLYPEKFAAYHVLSDNSVDTVLLRDPEYRLSDRQKSAVDEWLAKDNVTFHCMRDHPSHVTLSIVPGLLGIKLKQFRTESAEEYDNLLAIVKEELAKSEHTRHLEGSLWKEYFSDFLCHDSVSCDKWSNSQPFPMPVPPEIPSYEGQRYDENTMDKNLVARYVRQILNQYGIVCLCCICCSNLSVIKITPILCFRYAKYLNTKDTIKRDPGKVIAMSLHGKDPSQTRGALRNAQQAPVFFPGWTLRIYTISDNVTGNPVPKRLLNKMETLGAEVFYVDKPLYPEKFAAYHVLSDNSVDTVLLRDPEYRLSDRQKSAVDEWLAKDNVTFHCMRDHPSHVTLSIVPGLLGIKLKQFRTESAEEYDNLLAIVKEELAKSEHTRHLEGSLWKEYFSDFLCHDSVSCDKWSNSQPFPMPVPPEIPSYEGQRYDENMNPKQPYKYSQSEHKCPDKKRNCSLF